MATLNWDGKLFTSDANGKKGWAVDTSITAGDYFLENVVLSEHGEFSMYSNT